MSEALRLAMFWSENATDVRLVVLCNTGFDMSLAIMALTGRTAFVFSLLGTAASAGGSTGVISACELRLVLQVNVGLEIGTGRFL